LLATLPAAAQTIKIGIVNSYSGVLAQPGDELDKGLSLYAKLHAKDLPPGVKVEIIRRDDTSTSDVGKRVAQELIVRQHVQFLGGVIASPVALAIAPLSAEAKVPFVDMNASAAPLPRLSPYVVRVSFTQWQTAYPLGKWVAQQGWKVAYSAVSDFNPGWDAEAAFKKGIVDGGGTLTSVRFPLVNPDFSPFIQRIADARPNVAFVWVPAGTQATTMVKEIHDAKLMAHGTRIVATQDLLPDEELRNMGANAVGIISAGSYSATATRPANVAFVASWKKEYGANSTPDVYAVGGRDGMAAIFDTIEKTGGKFTADQAMAVLSHWVDPNSPRGPISIDPATREIVQNIYIRRAEMKNGKLVNTEFYTIPNVKDPWKEFNPPK
ncbi:MAG: ABC transporter substrate-binding protein, partial [Stellaceae bacterium]